MPSFVVLGNYTEQGTQNMGDLADRLEAVKQQLRDVDGRLIFYYLTLGQYDFVAVAEVPDAETVARIMLAISAQGNIRTATMRAFAEEEAIALVQS